MSKTTKSIIIAASVIIVLIVGTIVISNIDTSKDNNVDTTDDLYSIYSADTTDILSVKSESENGTITVKSIGDSEWSVNDMDASEIDSSKAGALVGTISTLSSKNKIEENTADLSQYGLDNPQVTVTVEKKNGQIDKMIIGDLSPTLGEYFVMKDGDNTVYTMYDFKVDTLKKPISYYKEFNRFNINIDNINDIKIVRSDETIEIRILSNINNNTNNVSPSTSGSMSWPTRITHKVNSVYAPRGRSDTSGYTGTAHKGLDIYAPAGTPVYAAKAGTVVYVNYSGYGGGWGLYVVIYHGTDSSGKAMYTRYAHASSIASGISVGTKVTTNTVIMYSGNTGASEGAHLHFEVCLGSMYSQVNPAPYLGVANARGTY